MQPCTSLLIRPLLICQLVLLALCPCGACEKIPISDIVTDHLTNFSLPGCASRIYAIEHYDRPGSRAIKFYLRHPGSGRSDSYLDPIVQRYSDGENRSVYGIMRPTQEQFAGWMLQYKSAPEAHIDALVTGGPEERYGSWSLLDHLDYTASQRDQGSCGNCWAWAGTAAMEIALDVERGIKDRLSIQYLNSNYNSAGDSWACCGGWLSDLTSYYSDRGMAIPLSNTNAEYQDKASTCDLSKSPVDANSISTQNAYYLDYIRDETIPTQGVGQEAAVRNIKAVLEQNRAVWLAFFLPTRDDWDDFMTFWRTESEDIVWRPQDLDICSTGADSGFGGHAVLCVGYNDTDPENRYWILLNSWGAPKGRPGGLFRMSMDIDYDCTIEYLGENYAFYWQTLDIGYTVPSRSGDCVGRVKQTDVPSFSSDSIQTLPP